MGRVALSALTAWILSPAIGATPVVAPTTVAATVLDVRTMPRGADDPAARVRELSGLDWNGARQRLVAVSDRGWVIEFALDAATERLDALRPVVAIEIDVKPRPNAESVVATNDGWLVADEARQRVLHIAPNGALRAERALPGALASLAADTSALRSANSGVEAIARHERHGRIAVTQRPRSDDPPGVHVVHADDGRTWSVPMSAGGKSTIKAADLRGERLRLLEKIDPDPPGEPDCFVVRELDLSAPNESHRTWRLDDARLAGHNLEGLACLDDTRCVLVSDSGGASRGKDTLFVLVRLTSPR